MFKTPRSPLRWEAGLHLAFDLHMIFIDFPFNSEHLHPNDGNPNKNKRLSWREHWEALRQRLDFPAIFLPRPSSTLHIIVYLIDSNWQVSSHCKKFAGHYSSWDTALLAVQSDLAVWRSLSFEQLAQGHVPALQLIAVKWRKAIHASSSAGRPGSALPTVMSPLSLSSGVQVHVLASWSSSLKNACREQNSTQGAQRCCWTPDPPCHSHGPHDVHLETHLFPKYEICWNERRKKTQIPLVE